MNLVNLVNLMANFPTELVEKETGYVFSLSIYYDDGFWEVCYMNPDILGESNLYGGDAKFKDQKLSIALNKAKNYLTKKGLLL